VAPLTGSEADRRLVAYRQERPRAIGAETRPAILACVAPRPGMEGLIRRSAALAAQVDGDFRAAAVADPRPRAPEEQLVAGYATLVAQLGGELTVLTGHDPAAALAAYAAEHRISEMVFARNDNNRPGRYPVLRALLTQVTDVELHVLPADPSA